MLAGSIFCTNWGSAIPGDARPPVWRSRDTRPSESVKSRARLPESERTIVLRVERGANLRQPPPDGDHKLAGVLL